MSRRCSAPGSRFAWCAASRGRTRLEFDPDVSGRFRKCPPGAPFLIHCGEGTDAAARREFEMLDSLGALDQRTAHRPRCRAHAARPGPGPPAARGPRLVPDFESADAGANRIAHRPPLGHPGRPRHRFRAERAGRSDRRTRRGPALSARGALARTSDRGPGAHPAPPRIGAIGSLSDPICRTRSTPSWTEPSRWW